MLARWSAKARARGAGAGPVLTRRLWAQRAEAAYAALQRHFQLDDGSGCYRESARSLGSGHAGLWPFSRALVGTLTLAGVPSDLTDGRRYDTDVDDRLAALQRYADPGGPRVGYRGTVAPPTGLVGGKFYDDNAWIGLALIQHHRATQAPGSLAAAQDVFAFVSDGGWDADPTHPHPGGNFWVQQGTGLGLTTHDRTATANAPNGELGFRLALADPGGAAGYVDAGAAMQDWVSRNLYNVGGSGLVYDKVRGDGRIDPTLWTYNQGALVAADVQRYRHDGEGKYLAQAEAVAAMSLAYFSQDYYLSHSPAFNAIYFRGLLQLHTVTASGPLKAAILTTMATYADTVWRRHRTRQNLFHFATSPGGVPLLFQGAVVQIFATLAWDPGDYPKLA